MIGTGKDGRVLKEDVLAYLNKYQCKLIYSLIKVCVTICVTVRMCLAASWKQPSASSPPVSKDTAPSRDAPIKETAVPTGVDTVVQLKGMHQTILSH